VATPDFKATFPDVPVTKASTDEGNVSWKIPMLAFRAATQAVGTPGHSWQLVAQTGMPSAMKAGRQVSKWMAASALTLMNEPKLIEAAWAEHNKYLSEIGAYKEALPPDTKLPTFEKLYGIKPEDVPGAKK
jgi:aminobenzoyl-glutamate utilization protein B